MPAKKDTTNDLSEPSSEGSVSDQEQEVREIKPSESKVVVDDRQAQLEAKLAEDRAPETVQVESPVPGNVDTEAFKESVDLKGTPDEELTLEQVHRKHHPEWYSDASTQSSDPTAVAFPNGDEDDKG